MRSISLKLLRIFSTTVAFSATGAATFATLFALYARCSTCALPSAGNGWTTLGLSLIAYCTLAGLAVDAVRLLSQTGLAGTIDRLFGIEPAAGMRAGASGLAQR